MNQLSADVHVTTAARAQSLEDVSAEPDTTDVAVRSVCSTLLLSLYRGRSVTVLKVGGLIPARMADPSCSSSSGLVVVNVNKKYFRLSTRLETVVFIDLAIDNALGVIFNFVCENRYLVTSLT